MSETIRFRLTGKAKAKVMEWKPGLNKGSGEFIETGKEIEVHFNEIIGIEGVATQINGVFVITERDCLGITL